MNEENVLFALLVIIITILVVVVFGAFVIVSGALATYVGLSGVNWWAGAIVTFLLLTGIVLMINRIGSK